MTKEERCVKWMRDVIEAHMDMEDGKRPTEGEHLEAIEDAEYIIDCIEKRNPKKPIAKSYMLMCTACNKPFSSKHYAHEGYCKHCGQHISDWSKEN